MTSKEMPKAKNPHLIRGIIAALAGASMWGFSGSSVQFLTSSYGLDPAFLTMIRTIIGGILFLGCMLVLHRQAVLGLLRDQRDRRLCIIFGFMLFANLITYAMAVQITNAATATVLQMLASVFIMIYMCVKTRSLPTLREGCALGLALLSTVLLATQGDIRSLEMPLAGLIWGVLCGLAAAAYIVFPQETGLAERYGSINVTATGTCAAAIFGIIYAVGLEVSGADVMATVHNLDAVGWLVIVVGIILVGTIGAYGLYLYGVSLVGNVRGSLLGAMEPISAAAFSALWLGTVFTGYDIGGLVLMILMLVLITK